MKKSEIPIIGHKFEADFGEFVYELYFKSSTVLIWKPLHGDVRNSYEEEIIMEKVRLNVYLVSWQEKDGTTVTHLEDFENEIVFSNVTTKELDFFNLEGSLKPVA